MKNILKYIITVSLLLTASCDKMDKIDFVTKHEFELSSSFNEFDVITKQETSILAITVNGEYQLMDTGRVIEEYKKTFNYDSCTALYINGRLKEITGSWFKIEIVDEYTKHIQIFENKENFDKQLDIEIFARVGTKHITIFQTKN